MTASRLHDGFFLRLQRRIAAALFATRAYGLLLPRRAPLELPHLPDESSLGPWPGSAANADRLFQGRFLFAGLEVVSPHSAPWGTTAADLNHDAAGFEAWAAGLHGFEWLRDFAAQNGEMARRMARSLVVSWLERHPRIHGRPWRADIAGRRLTSWLLNGHFLLDGADDRFGHDFLLAIARHATHLGHAARLAPPGYPRFQALLGLAWAVECMDDAAGRRSPALRELERCLDAQMLADGGHVSRNPSQLLAVMRDCVALWLFLRAIDPERAAPLQHHLDRMAPMLRSLRHGDGGLALFHGGAEENAAQVDLVLELSEARGKPLASASMSGFERAVAKRAVLLLDCGRPPDAHMPGVQSHRGLLAFEFSHGRDRLIVNCGGARSADWAKALSGIAAHSTLMLGDREPDAGTLPRISRSEQDGSILLDAEHDGWSRLHPGRIHRRRLYLAAGGEDLRGEDTVTAPAAGGGMTAARSADAMPVAVTLRLHLHPGVQASLIGTGDTVILKSAGGQGWRWRGAGGVVRLEDSIYLGRNSEPRRCQQIVMTGSAGATELVFKWALAKVG